MGVQLGFMGVQLGGEVIGPVDGLRLRCGDWRAAAGGCHCAFLMMKRRAAGCRGPALRAARSRLIVLVVSAGHVPGPAGQAGAAAACRLRNAGPAVPCRVSLDW